MKGSILVACALLAISTAELVNFTPCPGFSDNVCTVSSVDIDPCREHPKPCRLKKGKPASISFKFTPNFSASKLRTGAYWAKDSFEPSFAALDSEACKYTTCPSVAGTPNEYKYDLQLSKKLPQGTYPIKWKVWNEEEPNQVCCFLTTIILIR